jgi:DNA adenine methylase
LDNIERASRFIYLNKTSFNGIYQLIKMVDYDVPLDIGKLRTYMILTLTQFKMFKNCFFSVGAQKFFYSVNEMIWFIDPPYTVALKIMVYTI